MKFSCVHCGKPFAITAEQLGTSGQCPHCHETIHLPEAESQTTDEPGAGVLTAPVAWLKNSISMLVSLVFHTTILIALAMFTFGGQGVSGEGEDVFIGKIPSEKLTDNHDETLKSAESVTSEKTEESMEELEIEPPVDATADTATADMAISPLSPSSSSDMGDIGSAMVGGGGDMGGGNWDGMIRQLRRNGLDIVIAFDSTGSMSGEIEEVKSQIKTIGNTLVKLVPKARISLCTYRDQGDAYLVKGKSLTGDIQAIDAYLSTIQAGGGGDTPEAVHEGLRWAVESNAFRSQARKVILLFGDAPPHREKQQLCLEIASDFHRQQQGVVSTVTCRLHRPMKEFVDIAEAGGGEAFLTRDKREIVKQLIILVFGSKYRSKVLEAFKEMDR